MILPILFLLITLAIIIAIRRRPPCTLFVLSGAPGSGKSTVLSILASLGVAIFQKDTTRARRDGERVSGCPDSDFITLGELSHRAERPGYVTYPHGKDFCGVDLNRLRETVRKHRLIACTITDTALVRRLPHELTGVRVVPVMVYADRSIIDGRFAPTPHECDARHSRAPRIMAAYQEAPLLFQHTILNIFEPEVLERHVRELVACYTPTAHKRGAAMWAKAYALTTKALLFFALLLTGCDRWNQVFPPEPPPLDLHERTTRRSVTITNRATTADETRERIERLKAAYQEAYDQARAKLPTPGEQGETDARP